ncbi:MAG TPA: diphosphomevalonate decarboxylase [Kiritimatiellia bacterium]|nr:diphosphomevalonate decarboxylase [Kiritimatiellia bacterium]HPA77928.1 diphosphomevalonate decarboxylase [Kiritimatiellia bacterium]HQQ03991.1 diphosphomevalonate decarboxylase [Kiritimatiellia bacterium]
MTDKEAAQLITGAAKGCPKECGQAYAPVNIALCKYWGKRDEMLNLPVTSSLSLSLPELGATTRISFREGHDQLFLDGVEQSRDSVSARRVSKYLDLFRPDRSTFFHVESESTVPIAAGLASSASGFAALALALNDLFQWNLGLRDLSILARLGSGSAARSIYTGFVLWHAGTREDGMDSFAEPVDGEWPGLCMGLIMVSRREKAVSSRIAMKRTVDTSALYRAWPAKVESDLKNLRQAIEKKDFDLLGRTAESNALAMHATMMDSQPPVLYWMPETVEEIRKIWRLRDNGLPVYFTMDAGPNIKMLFMEKDASLIREHFPDMEIALI